MTGWPDGAPDPSGWRVESRREVVRDRYLNLTAERVVTGDGRVLDPFWVIEVPDWVNVVALTPDRRMVLVRQWRQAAQAWVLEPPGGLMDPGEDACATARRELREETGYDTGRLRVVATPWSDPSRNRNRLHVVLAEGAVPVAEAHPEEGEELRTVVMPVAEVLAGLPGGLLSHGAQLGGVMLALVAAGYLKL